MTDLEPIQLDVAGIPAAMAADLVAAAADFDNVTKSKTADAGSYSYAYVDHGAVMDMVRPVLAKHNLALLQPTSRETGEQVVTIETWLVHVSGSVLRWRFTVSAVGSPQQVGSAITYGRRYSAMAALGIAAEDDDGQAAEKAHLGSSYAAALDAAPIPDESTRRTRHAMALFGDLGLADRAERLAVTSEILGRDIGSWSDTSPIEQHRVISELMARRALADEELSLSADEERPE